MKRLLGLFLITLLFSQAAFGVNSKYYQNKFKVTKKLYLGAIMNGNKTKEIQYLKKLIKYGDKLKRSTYKYKRELKRIDKSYIIQKKIITSSILKQKYTIKSVTQNNNTIIINFYKNINTSYIDFIERKDKYNYYDEFNIKGSFKDAKPTKLSMYGVAKIQVYQVKKNLLKISLKNKRNLKTIYIVSKKQIIIKVYNRNTKEAKSKSIKKVRILPNNNFYPYRKTIVIDAGHGGKDSGAVGKHKRYEKVIVLSIAKYLKKDLEQSGFKVYLTRNRDKFIKLSRRTHFANVKKADMFVSIHANSAKKSRANKAHGIETYFLSPARSTRAKRVAASENKGDMKQMGWSSKNSLLTILNQSKITESNKIAIDIQKNILFQLRNKYGKSQIKDGGVREGPFWVLVGAQMPSVLIEVGYVSHPIEGKRIYTKSYQKRIALGIANGIKSYCRKN